MTIFIDNTFSFMTQVYTPAQWLGGGNASESWMPTAIKRNRRRSYPSVSSQWEPKP